MLRERNKLIVRIHRTLDVCLTTTAFISAYFIKRYFLSSPFHGLTIAPNYYILLLIVVIIWYLTFNGFDLYSSYRRRDFRDIFLETAKAVSTAMLFLILCMFILKITDVSRIMLGIFFMLDISLLGLSKGMAYYFLQCLREMDLNYRNVLVIGSRERAKDIINTIDDQQSSGFRVIGCMDVDRCDVGKDVINGVKVVGTIDHIETFMREEVVDEAIFAMPLRMIEKVGDYLKSAEEIGVSVRIAPDWQVHALTYRPGIASIHFEDFLGIPTMALHTTPVKHDALLVKGAFDFLFAFIALMILLPFLAIISGAIKLFSKGPILFIQERCGLNGRKFRVYKFRTMVDDAEKRREEMKDLNESDGPVFKIRKDPRIIPYIGTFLRKTGLDELPQFINVLKGEMSLVGPRPPMPKEVDQYDRWQRRRLSIKPGLTCLWQISHNRNDLSFEQWMKLDIEYINKWSLWLDLRIILMTIRVMLWGEGR